MSVEEQIKRAEVVSGLHEKVGKREMLRHEFVNGNINIQKVTFAGGVSVLVDFEKQTYSF